MTYEDYRGLLLSALPGVLGDSKKMEEFEDPVVFLQESKEETIRGVQVYQETLAKLKEDQSEFSLNERLDLIDTARKVYYCLKVLLSKMHVHGVSEELPEVQRPEGMTYKDYIELFKSALPDIEINFASGTLLDTLRDRSGDILGKIRLYRGAIERFKRDPPSDSDNWAAWRELYRCVKNTRNFLCILTRYMRNSGILQKIPEIPGPDFMVTLGDRYKEYEDRLSSAFSETPDLETPETLAERVQIYEGVIPEILRDQSLSYPERFLLRGSARVVSCTIGIAADYLRIDRPRLPDPDQIFPENEETCKP